MTTANTTPSPSYRERALTSYINLVSSFFVDGKLNHAHEAFCPVIAAQILCLRARIDRYAFTADSLQAVKSIGANEWLQLVGIARDGFVKRDSSKPHGKLMFECEAFGLWLAWTEFRVQDREWNETNVPSDVDDEADAACAVAEELDRCALLLSALGSILRLPDVSSDAKQELFLLSLCLRQEMREQIEDADLLTMKLWREQADPAIGLVLDGIQPALWLSSSFRNGMFWAAKPNYAAIKDEIVSVAW